MMKTIGFGIDSVSRSIDLSFGNSSHSFTASPNTAYAFDEDARLIKEVPFNYPYKE